MSTRSDLSLAFTADLSRFETRDTTLGLSTWILTFITFFSLVEVLSRLIQAQTSWWLTATVYFAAVLFHARLFILMHDCGHNRLTASNQVNTWLGHLCAFTYLMPFLYWRDLHNQHHRYQGNLDQRNQHFDLWTLTVAEYEASSRARKLIYRFYRSPFSLFILGPILFFGFFLRWPPQKKSASVIKNILSLNLLLFLLITASFNNTELRLRMLIFFGVILFNFSAAIWLFYQQHVFADTYWARDTDFTNEEISFKGSSFIVFPKWMSWFMASIGYHHIHHFNTKIPFYLLKPAHKHLEEQKILSHEKELGFVEMLQNTRLKLWCEEQKKLIRFPS